MILQAEKFHLIEAMFVYENCVLEMNQRGLFNWNTFYPSIPQVKNDIEKGNLFMYRDKNIIIGIVCLDPEEPEEYRNLSWEYPGPPLFVHRLAVYPAFRNKGIAETIMNFALKYARDNRYASIRLDAILNNPQAVRLYEKLNYKPVADIHLNYQKELFRCMEYRVNSF